METPDFTLLSVAWIPATGGLDKQYQQLRMKVDRHKPDCVVIVGLPRHHAKKVAQQDWTKDYYQSKEKRTITESRLTRVCTVVYSRYPFTSEQWVNVGVSSNEANESSQTEKGGFAHIAEICIPIGAWRAHRSPIEVLQEIQSSLADGVEVGYDEVSTITVVVATSDVDVGKLKQAFSVDKVRNTIVFVASGLTFVEPCWWRTVNDDNVEADVVRLLSDPLR